MRINKFIAASGVASRRKAENLILEGRIRVNDKVITDLSYQVNESIDKVTFDFKPINIKDEKHVYIMLNKPEGYISSVKDQFNRKSVTDLTRDIKERIYPVGRLDYETSGLLIMTNDGDLTYKITHPKHEMNKVYIASVRGIISQEEKHAFENGLKIDGYTTSNASLKIIKTDAYKNYSVCKVTIHEGKNRQVRKMFQAINHPAMNLKRVQIGSISIGDLEVGKYRELTDKEVKYLKKI